MASSILWPLLGVMFVVFLFLRKTDPRLKHIPIVRYSSYLPDIFNRLIFYPRASSMIYGGYEKYRNSPFRVLTGDGEIVVLPVKYLEELRHLPPAIISSLDAQYENALGDYTNIVISSYLPSMTVRKRLTPSLTRVTPWIIDELRYAFDAALPECDGNKASYYQVFLVQSETYTNITGLSKDRWVSVKPHELFVQLIARATSRVVAGEALRRNEEWLNTASAYSINVGLTVLLLRPFPSFARPFVAPFLPPVRQMKQQLQFVKDLFAPMIIERRKAEDNPKYVKPDDFLQWMMDMAEDEQDLDPEMLAHHMLLLMSLAVVHTSSMALCHALYDLIARPEYLAPLREEINRTLSSGWDHATKASLDAQRRLDSFLRESQRFGPPGECAPSPFPFLLLLLLVLIREVSFHRIVKESLTLSDGIQLPRGTHICFPSGPISKDPAFITNPKVFDGFRWCPDPKDRHALVGADDASSTDTGSEKQHPTSLAPSTSTSFVSISASNMHFGVGRQACPGRFFAANTIKAILSRIIMDYEFKFDDDFTGRRPANFLVGEHILPNTSTPVLFRKRSVEH
ncbi:uncharacterized protein N7459_008177 [Penicillium hispanicum]|uniref:uncharacterized protein n=1 Tax=Penicillium hispanicum TaxID=1080232 RepID=UPI0025409147|nr:uncharacterized protein N7459_008177 [Penicillium hispanicum]KAJ5573750.1 hypothetical protein N7459_008177 [Penicillium hispanicum]